MKQMSPRKAAIAVSTIVCAAMLSFGWSEQGGVSLSVGSAQARVGRPLTPMSFAGVSRRHARRAIYGAGIAGAAGAAYYYGGVPSYGVPYYGVAPYYGAGPYGYYNPYGVWGPGNAPRGCESGMTSCW